MPVLTKLFQSILSERGQLNRSKTGDLDRRQAERHPVCAWVQIQAINSDGTPSTSEEVWLQDVSTAGVGIMHNGEIAVGRQLLLHVKGLGDVSPLRCVIVRCAAIPEGAGSHIVAAHFIDEDSLMAGAMAPGGESSTLSPTGETIADQIRAIGETSSVGTAMVGGDHHVIWMNAAGAKLLGRTPAQLAGMKFEEFTHPDDVTLDSHLAERLFGGSLQSYRMRKRFTLPGGKFVALDLTASLVRDAKGNVLFGLATILPASEETPAPKTTPKQSKPATGGGPDDDLGRIRKAMLD